MISFEWRKRIGPVLSLTIKNKRFAFCLCHRKEDRCFKIFGRPFPVCSRCTGLLIGVLFAFIFIGWSGSLPFLLGIGLMSPLLIDGTTQALGYRESNNTLRFITGLLFSIGLIWSVL